MSLDDYAFRPITFQGVAFPPSLMAISMLGRVLAIADGDLDDWLWRFPICCGWPKTAPAERCAGCAQRLADLMLEQRTRVLDGIREQLAEYGFDPETTYREWLLSLQRIVELSEAAEDKCTWSAPIHVRDALKSKGDLDRLLTKLTKQEPGNG
jgi:hypothetical protein